jgi:hypothetical protein
MSRKRLVELALVIATASGCQKSPTPVATPAPSSNSTAALSAPRCFSVRADQNSAVARAVFDEKHCQGGGVTWAAIVRVLLKRRGRSEPVLEPTPGWSGDVHTLTWDGGSTRWSLDDEADNALFCADSARLVKEVEAQLKTLNSEKAALEDALAAANPLELEGLPSGASAAEVLARLEPPPPLSPAEASAAKPAWPACALRSNGSGPGASTRAAACPAAKAVSRSTPTAGLRRSATVSQSVKAAGGSRTTAVWS